MKEEQERTPLRTILQNFLNHIENLDTQKIEGSYEKEFQELKLFSEILKTSKHYSCSQGEKEVNRKKNRYKDILPFDASRVILDGYAGVPGSDYINANYIKGASGSPAYIASQGPLPHTVNDFWRMVVECEVQVIVMACNEEEAGKHKCENYWVEREGEEKQFGMVSIRLVKASVVCPDFLVRTMRLKYTNSQSSLEERTVCQFHYSAWPDHGVPPLVRPLLDMVRLVRDTQASETLPVLVHCSAGCGRTGTICAIDYVWGLLRAGKLTNDFSLFKLVRDMRRQRIAMVQTKEQYVLVHHAVRELFCEQLRMIDSHPYENIDVNGMPLVKEYPEPMYATISNEISNEEKQDNKEKENTIQEETNVPPLPHKKRTHIASSKQEKEVENLTEKQRSTVEHSSSSDTGSGSSVGSLLQKPRIAKLKALFERSSLSRESRNLQSKHRSSQQVMRSHSLGAVRKCGASEPAGNCPSVGHQEQSTAAQPIPCRGILRVPQLTTATSTSAATPASFGRPALPIKRSKSLKVLGSGDRYKLSVVAVDKSFPFKAQKTSDSGSGDVLSSSEASALVPHCNGFGDLVKDKIPSDVIPCVPPKKIVRDRNSERELGSNSSDIGNKGSSKHYANVSHFPGKSCEDTRNLPAAANIAQSRRRRSLESFAGTLEEGVSPVSVCHVNSFEAGGSGSQDASKSSHLDRDAHKLWQDCRDYLLSSTKSETCLIRDKVCSKQHDKQMGGPSRNEQFQNLTVDAQKKINSIIAGLGVRERRNSFRQAINTSKDTKAEIGSSKAQRYESIWLDKNASHGSEGNLCTVQPPSVSSRKENVMFQSKMDSVSNSHPNSSSLTVSSHVAAKGNRDSVQKNLRRDLLQQVEKSVEGTRRESGKHYSKSSIGKASSLRIKGVQVLGFPREMEVASSKLSVEMGRLHHSGYSQQNRNIAPSRVENVMEKGDTVGAPMRKVSRSSQWPVITPPNLRLNSADASRLDGREVRGETAGVPRGSARKYPVSTGPVISQPGIKFQDHRNVNVSVARRVNMSEAIPVVWPSMTVVDATEKMTVPKKPECSDNPKGNALLSGWVHATDVAFKSDVSCESRDSRARVNLMENLESRESGIGCSMEIKKTQNVQAYTSLQEKKSRPSGHIQLGQGSVQKKDAECMMEGARAVVVRRREQSERAVQPSAMRRDEVATAAQAAIKPNQTDTDVVSYGLVAGVQLHRGSRDDLALCSSLGPTAPPRVRRHASVVLLRHSLIETSEGAAMAPLTVWNVPQQGQGPSVNTRSTPSIQKSEAWSGAPGVDLDAVAANIKLRQGEPGTPLTRALEALHLRKFSPRTAPRSPPMARSFGERCVNPVHSPPVKNSVQSQHVKKQHYL